ncbi:MAG: hypothetical protein WCC95_11980 [Candidatus Sulfotelmatobacter sp.]|jgi:hypothetical protein
MTEREKGKAKDTTTTRTPGVCSDFKGNPLDPVEWQGVPSTGCTISSISGQTWPFNLPSSISLPSPSTVTIKSGLPNGTYSFSVSCCPLENATKTVTVPG